MAEVIIDLLEKKLEFFSLNDEHIIERYRDDFMKKYYMMLKDRIYERVKYDDRFGCQR